MLATRATPPGSWVAALAATVFVACSGTSGGTRTPMSIGVSNETTLAVTVVVNAKPIKTIAPHGYDPNIPESALPPLPWHVEAQTSRGRVLTALNVQEGDVKSTTRPDGVGEQQGDGVRVDLSCGRLDIWSGPPLSGPVPGPGTPGDCDP